MQVAKRQLDTYGSPVADPQIDSYGPPNAPICNLQVMIMRDQNTFLTFSLFALLFTGSLASLFFVAVKIAFRIFFLTLLLFLNKQLYCLVKFWTFQNSVSHPFCDNYPSTRGCNESNYPNNTDRLVNVFVAARVPGIS